MELVSVGPTIEENEVFTRHPDCNENLQAAIDYFNKIGHHPPWIGYYARLDGEFVGSAAYKGQPIDGKVEIAYGTFERFKQQGIGTQIAQKLIELALSSDPLVEITARTLPENNFSTRILEKSGFKWIGTIDDKDDGEVWEWKYQK